LADLDTLGDEGYLIQRRIVTNLCGLRRLPDETVPDRDAGLQAIKWLKQLAVDQKRTSRSRRTSPIGTSRKLDASRPIWPREPPRRPNFEPPFLLWSRPRTTLKAVAMDLRTS
jgi:hypothetical protein